LGRTIEFKRIVSAGTLTEHPKIVIDGFRRPSLLKSGGFSILAKALFGSGSDGVPSTRAHVPILEFLPIILCNIKLRSLITASDKIMLSRILTPGPMTTPDPMLTLGPI
jgi:hypothetical protein